MNTRMPVLFVGHGNPMNAIERTPFHLKWEELGKKLPGPDAILCISAHWETGGVHLTAAEKPETIHDFYGFPQALFDVRYPAPGSPDLARRTAELLAPESPTLDEARGLDHGVWAVLIAMYPDANVPIVQLSLDTSRPGGWHHDLAKRLAPLRREGVMIVASGNIVHNLRLFSYTDPEPLDWAVECDEKVREFIVARSHETLANYPSSGLHAELAIPTPEHYLPLLYTVALREDDETVSFFNCDVLKSISMTSVLIGMNSAA